MSNLDIHVPDEGKIWRNKSDHTDFSSWLRLGTGRSIDEYEQVPLEVYEQYKAEQEAVDYTDELYDDEEE